MNTASRTSVRDILLDRLAEKSVPGQRNDDHHLVLAVEGGGMRGAISSGMLLALEQLGLRDGIDEIVGTSAGAIASAFFVTRKGTAGSVLYYTVLNSDRFLSRRRLFGEGAVMDLDYLFDEALPAHGLSWDDLVNSDIPLWATVTPADGSDPSRLYRVGGSVEHAKEVLTATATLPVIGGSSRHIGSKPYVDGGMIEAVPWVTAIRRDATHVLVIRSRGYNKDGKLEPNSLIERTTGPRFVRRIHGDVVNEYVKRSNERFWASTEALRTIIEGTGSPVAGGERGVVVEAVLPGPETDLPDRLEVDTHVLMDALTAGAQAMLDYINLEGFAVEQRVVVTHPRAPVGKVRTNSLRPIVLDRRHSSR